MNIFLFLPIATFSQKAEAVKFSFIDSLINNKSDTTYVLNFWATWCNPCVKELPYFEELNAKYADKKFKMILVSMDFKRELNSRLIPFIDEKNIKSTVVLLDEPDYNSWIDKVNKRWGGAIPATMVINNSRNWNKFYETEFTYEELENIVKPLIN